MKIQLTRPIAFIDLETTGVDRQNDRIVEIAVCKYMPSGQYKTLCRKVNPTIPIPEGATAVHGISDADVANEPTFKKIAKGLLELLEGCDIAGFNSNSFDVPLLFNEFNRAGHFWDHSKFLMIDAGNLFKIQEPRTLSAAVKFYLGKDLEDAHSAQADIEATLDVLLAQLARYENLEGFPQTIEELALYTNYGNKVADLSGKFVYDDKGELILNFGKHRGNSAKNHIDFLEWMLRANFAADTYALVTQIIDEHYHRN
ncbi:3'-5' exonuclease [Dyadobacter alkalitolerans]|uniref:3'-5' exonuclease n=1 Tax=Dyadobacter alkalitolerans TaxID=492736 RepID=UPI00041C2F25|nr:3'-5' exonuclease [Dyadobacter alkalitolerans]